LSWQTSKAFVSSKIRMDRIDKIEPIKGTLSSGAIEKYISKVDFPELAGLTEGGFAIDINLRKSPEKRKVDLTGNSSSSDDNEAIDMENRKIGGSDSSSDSDKYSLSDVGILAFGESDGSSDELQNFTEYETAIFWYNGKWNIIKKLMKNNDPYIPIELANRVIESGNGIIKERLAKNEITAKLEKSTTFKDIDHETVNSREMANKMKMDELFSMWEFEGTLHIMLNTYMKDGPYIIKRTNEKIDIKLYVEFKNSSNTNGRLVEIDGMPKEAQTAIYMQKIKEGFNLWAGNYPKREDKLTSVSKFGYNTINVNSYISDSIKMNRAKISINNNFPDKYVEHISNVKGNWAINKVGEMTMYNHYQKSEQSTIYYNVMDYIKTACHEFGHMLGLGDAYHDDENIEAPVTLEVPAEDIMRGNSKISDSSKLEVTLNDIHMLFLATLKNKKQYFYTLGNKKISEAITK
jgi:hypothetical protein